MSILFKHPKNKIMRVIKKKKTVIYIFVLMIILNSDQADLLGPLSV